MRAFTATPTPGAYDRDVGARAQIAGIERLAAAERHRKQRLAARIEAAIEIEVVTAPASRTRSAP